MSQALHGIEALVPPTTEAPLITRFAPSPTGELHLGHVYHALWVWGVAEKFGATVVVRMEDHDQTRCTPEFEASILSDLAWLGFVPEPNSLHSLSQRPSEYRQSDHAERYAKACAALGKTARVYSCLCTRAAMGPPDAEGERRHPDGCRGANVDEGDGAALRVELPDREVEWRELRGMSMQENPWQRVGDTMIRDALGQWSYQLSVVVDDIHDGVNLVVRGEDLRSSTGRQVLLRELLGDGREVWYCHHPLLMDESGRKLSKRDQSESVRAMRERGMSAPEIVQRAVEWGVIR